MTAELPPWLMDQVNAAAAQAESALAATGMRKGKNDPVWDAMGVSLTNRALLRWFFQGDGMCPHAIGPMPMFLFIWKPTKIMCPGCLGAGLGGMAGTDEDTRCDNCGVVPGDGLVHPIGASLGPLTVLGGVCTGCAEGVPV